MRRQYRTITGTQVLSTLTLFCYGGSLLALFVIGYSIVALALAIADQQVTYSLHGIYPAQFD